LYDEYSAAVKEVGNLRVKVITDYAANYENMTDEIARQLLDDAVKYEEQKTKLKKKYIKKFRKILPDVKVTRFFQLENKLNAVVDFDLAAEIPLME
jgi:Na+/phosphate symporter